LAAIGAVGMAAALVIFGVSHEPISAVSAGLLAGASWTVTLTKHYVLAQVALQDWARGRGLAVFLIIFGATTLGSAIWGKITELQGSQDTCFVSAACLLKLAVSSAEEPARVIATPAERRELSEPSLRRVCLRRSGVGWRSAVESLATSRLFPVTDYRSFIIRTAHHRLVSARKAPTV
jgi:Transmembrane secretion effector